MSISVQSVSKLYGSQRALDNVSFSIESGQIVGFLGPNGAGKSTMMKILTCYMTQNDGEVKVCGINTLEDPIAVQRSIGYLPEHNPLYLDMYVKEYLEFVAGIYKVDQVSKKIKEMIDLTGLGDEQHKQIGQLSKGYRQRVGLAQALIHDPKVLILDEPTTGLDPNQLSDIRNLIKNVGKSKTVILSTHIMQEVEAMCDRTIIINKGKIVANENTAQLKNTKVNKQAWKVEFNKTVSIDSLKGIEGIIDVVSAQPCVYLIETSTDTVLGPLITKWSVENSVDLIGLNKESRKLEDIFHELTRSK